MINIPEQTFSAGNICDKLLWLPGKHQHLVPWIVQFPNLTSKNHWWELHQGWMISWICLLPLLVFVLNKPRTRSCAALRWLRFPFAFFLGLQFTAMLFPSANYANCYSPPPTKVFRFYKQWQTTQVFQPRSRMWRELVWSLHQEWRYSLNALAAGVQEAWEWKGIEELCWLH